jgi:hypothetical protein
LVHKWTFDDHLFPTASERQSFSSESTYGGGTLQRFNSGCYALFRGGRYHLIQMREFNKERVADGQAPLDLALAEPPHCGFPNTDLGTRAVVIYTGGKERTGLGRPVRNEDGELVRNQYNHAELATYFMAFLAGDDYNLNVVLDADGLPPAVSATTTMPFHKPLPQAPWRDYFSYDEGNAQDQQARRAWRRQMDRFHMTYDRASLEAGEPLDVARLPLPPKPQDMDSQSYADACVAFTAAYVALVPLYRSEWGLHEGFSTAAREIAIGTEFSPFVSAKEVSRAIGNERDRFMNQLIDAEACARRTAARIEERIQLTLHERPDLRERYDKLCALQAKIDRYRAAGKPVPVQWIKNPFHRRYYRARGWLEE